MRLKGKDNAVTRVVLWGKDESLLPKVISQDAKIRLLGVRTKTGNQGLEIHGNEANDGLKLTEEKKLNPLLYALQQLTEMKKKEFWL